MKEYIIREAERLRRECRKLEEQAENLLFETWAWEEETGNSSLRGYAEEAHDLIQEAGNALGGMRHA